MSKKSFIDSVRVASPCSEDWEKMEGNERVRFCSHCSKHVNNLSDMTRKEAMRLVRASGGKLCIRYIPDPHTKRPLFAEQLLQITRRTPRLTAGVMSASLSLSTLAYAQTEAQPSLHDNNANIVSTVNANNNSEGEEAESSDPALGSVEGFIWDTSGKGVPEVRLILIDSDSDDTEYETTDENGYYQFNDLEEGTYILRIETSNGSMKKAFPGIELAEGQKVVRNLHVTLVTAAEGEGHGYGYGIGGAMAVIPYSLPLSQAVASEEIEVVRELIAKGETTNGRDANYDDITPLFIAVENGNYDIAKLLLDHGANVNAADKRNRTPLMFLDDDATVELVDLLLRAGADIHAKDDNGNSVLLATLRSIDVTVLNALIAAGADINVTDESGDTLLIKAAEENAVAKIKALLDAGADVNVRNNAGESAWDRTSNIEIESLLIERGATADYGNLTVALPDTGNTADDQSEEEADEN
jgi:ankyrin repeat protein